MSAKHWSQGWWRKTTSLFFSKYKTKGKNKILHSSIKFLKSARIFWQSHLETGLATQWWEGRQGSYHATDSHQHRELICRNHFPVTLASSKITIHRWVIDVKKKVILLCTATHTNQLLQHLKHTMALSAFMLSEKTRILR